MQQPCAPTPASAQPGPRQCLAARFPSDMKITHSDLKLNASPTSTLSGTVGDAALLFEAVLLLVVVVAAAVVA